MKEFLARIHTDRFSIRDNPLIISIFTLILILAGQIIGSIIAGFVYMLFEDQDFGITFVLYFQTIGVWLAFMAVILIFKRRRPMLKALGPKCRGNSFRYLCYGLLGGFATNMLCALVAMAHHDIHLSFNRFEPLAAILLFIAVFIQSSSEELACRVYMFQGIKGSYKNVWLAILWNASYFACLHLLNPGVTVLSVVNIFLSGLIFTFWVYYFDSLYAAFAFHTGWNYTQSILLGLPNSGQVVPYSIFTLDTASASNSFAYDVGFGIEGTLLSVAVLVIFCGLMYYFGSKRQQKPLDIYQED